PCTHVGIAESCLHGSRGNSSDFHRGFCVQGPRSRGDDIAIRVLAFRSEVVKDGCLVERLVRAQDSNELKEHADVVLPTDGDVELVSSLADLSVAREPCVDSKTQKEALNITCQPVAAAGVVNVRVVSDSVRQMNATVSCPQVAQEESDPQCRLLEYFQRHALLVGAEAKGPQFFEPDPHRIAYSMCEMAGWRQVHLDPRPFGLDSRTYRIPEKLFGEVYNCLGQDQIVGRVLDRVGRQRAAVSDEVSQQA